MIYNQKHHIIPKHEWKRRYGSLKALDETGRGINHPINIIHLTEQEHIDCHHMMWNSFSRIGDKLAYLGMTKQIDKKEMKGRKKSIETRLKISKSKQGQIPWNKGIRKI